jgi:hypothetical protein
MEKDLSQPPPPLPDSTKTTPPKPTTPKPNTAQQGPPNSLRPPIHLASGHPTQPNHIKKNGSFHLYTSTNPNHLDSNTFP